MPADPQNSTFDIYYNQNQATTDITTRYVTLKETIPNLKEMIDYSNKEEEKEQEPLPVSKKGKYFFLGAALLSFILFIVLMIIIYKHIN